MGEARPRLFANGLVISLDLSFATSPFPRRENSLGGQQPGTADSQPAGVARPQQGLAPSLPTPCSPCLGTQACLTSLPTLPQPLVPSHSSAIPLHTDGPGGDHPLPPRPSPPPLPGAPRLSGPGQRGLTSPCASSQHLRPSLGPDHFRGPSRPTAWEGYCPPCPPGPCLLPPMAPATKSMDNTAVGKALGSACLTAVCHHRGGLGSSSSAPGRP